ncbi:MAG: hypothetical protein PF569_09400 [Candidatus Woesearchaeota archaeon]|jgi:predicted transcriptional regulator|nr:hypothetical protein [Candidatus Woesearchaeota archaeon]
MKLSEQQKIIIEFLELIETEPISYYEIERVTKRHYSTVRSYIDFLELFGFLKIEKIMNGKYIKYEITITNEGEKVRARIRERKNNL